MEPLGAALSPSQASRTQGALSTNEQRASSAGPPYGRLAVCGPLAVVCLPAAQTLHRLPASQPHSLPPEFHLGAWPECCVPCLAAPHL